MGSENDSRTLARILLRFLKVLLATDLNRAVKTCIGDLERFLAK